MAEFLLRSAREGLRGGKEEKLGSGGSNLVGKCWRAGKRNAIPLFPRAFPICEHSRVEGFK